LSQKKKTSTIQVSPELNLVLTKYATEQGITKAEAADRVFNILYPKGVGAEAEPSLAPPAEGTEEGTETPSTGLEFEEGEDVSKELAGTVKDLRAVRTIRALSAGLEKGEAGNDKLTYRDAVELEKIRALRGGGNAGTDALDAAFQKYILPLQTRLDQLQTQVQENRVSAAEKERDEYKRRLDERESKEQRQEEIMAIVGPQQEQFKELSDRVTTLVESLKPSSETPPTREEASDELKAINNLAVEIRNGLQKLGTGGGGGGAESLTVAIDTLTTLIDKINEVGSKFRGGGEGDFDWRAAGISSLTEVANEAFKTYRAIHGTSGEEEGEESLTSGERKEQVSEQVILRRVYNYAVKKIAEGDLQLNPYDAAKELNLTPNRVWWAVEELRKKGMLKAGTTGEKGEVTPGTTKTPEQLQAEGLLDI